MPTKPAGSNPGKAPRHRRDWAGASTRSASAVQAPGRVREVPSANFSVRSSPSAPLALMPMIPAHDVMPRP
jgi:hypothetical protein